jgi:hypothetical protein
MLETEEIKNPPFHTAGSGKIQILEIRRGLALMAQFARFATLLGSGHAQWAAGAFSARMARGMSGFRFINGGKLP